jgi:hypothetical protein
MDAQDFRSLQEAYMEVYQELDEERIPVRKRGGVSAPEDQRSIGGEANRRNKDYWASVEGRNRDRGAGSKAKRRAAALNKEDVDIYDIILSHLLDEGYAETSEAAEAIMVNMSEEWREDIVEISQKTATKAYATSYTGEFEGQDSPKNVKQTDNLRRQIKRKFGDKAAQHADRAGHAMTFGRKGAGGMPPKP